MRSTPVLLGLGLLASTAHGRPLDEVDTAPYSSLSGVKTIPYKPTSRLLRHHIAELETEIETFPVSRSSSIERIRVRGTRIPMTASHRMESKRAMVTETATVMVDPMDKRAMVTETGIVTVDPIDKRALVTETATATLTLPVRNEAKPTGMLSPRQGVVPSWMRPWMNQPTRGMFPGMPFAAYFDGEEDMEDMDEEEAKALLESRSGVVSDWMRPWMNQPGRPGIFPSMPFGVDSDAEDVEESEVMATLEKFAKLPKDDPCKQVPSFYRDDCRAGIMQSLELRAPGRVPNSKPTMKKAGTCISSKTGDFEEDCEHDPVWFEIEGEHSGPRPAILPRSESEIETSVKMPMSKEEMDKEVADQITKFEACKNGSLTPSECAPNPMIELALKHEHPGPLPAIFPRSASKPGPVTKREITQVPDVYQIAIALFPGLKDCLKLHQWAECIQTLPPTGSEGRYDRRDDSELETSFKRPVFKNEQDFNEQTDKFFAQLIAGKEAGANLHECMNDSDPLGPRPIAPILPQEPKTDPSEITGPCNLMPESEQEQCWKEYRGGGIYARSEKSTVPTPTEVLSATKTQFSEAEASLILATLERSSFPSALLRHKLLPRATSLHARLLGEEARGSSNQETRRS